jgi:divalent metal cation (Fe/Co/Zn/Cd) transporter
VKDTRPQVRKVLFITLLLNIAVLLIKLVVGLWTGSLSLIADALHSVTDSLNNVLGLVAMRFASPYPDRDHPTDIRSLRPWQRWASPLFWGWPA